MLMGSRLVCMNVAAWGDGHLFHCAVIMTCDNGDMQDPAATPTRATKGQTGATRRRRLGDAESLSDWGATDDGTGSRPGSAAPSPDRRPSASLFFSLFTMHSSQQ